MSGGEKEPGPRMPVAPMAEVRLIKLAVDPRNTLPYRIFKRPFIARVAHLVQRLQRIKTEEVQVFGSENVLETDEPGPFLWLIKHESTYDFYYIFPLWLELPTRRDFRIAKRMPPGFSLEAVLDYTILRGLIFHFRRNFMGEAKSAQQKQSNQLKNVSKFDAVRRNYMRGIDAVMFPEGTAVTNGYIHRIRSGCYNCAQIRRADGGIDVVASVPVGLTIDLMSGSWNPSTRKPRHLAFVYAAKPFYYEPMAGLAEDPTSDELKNDITNHTNRVFNSFLDLNVYTAAQLAGEHIIRKATARRCDLTKDEVAKVVRARAERIKGVAGAAVDRALVDCEKSFEKRIDNYFDSLLRMNYVSGGEIDPSRTLTEPDPGQPFRRKNPLLFCANRLRHVGEQRPHIKQILDETYAETVTNG